MNELKTRKNNARFLHKHAINARDTAVFFRLQSCVVCIDSLQTLFFLFWWVAAHVLKILCKSLNILQNINKLVLPYEIPN